MFGITGFIFYLYKFLRTFLSLGSVVNDLYINHRRCIGFDSEVIRFNILCFRYLLTINLTEVQCRVLEIVRLLVEVLVIHLCLTRKILVAQLRTVFLTQ